MILTVIRIGMVYSVKSNQVIIEMTQDANNLVDIGSNAIKRPLWDFDLDNVEDIADTLILDESVAEIVITDDKGNLIVQKIKQFPVEDRAFLSRTRQIYFNDTHIGNITISFTDRFYIQKRNTQMLNEVYMGLLEIMILGVLILFISSRITQPLERITNIAQKIAQGKLDNTIEVTMDDEVGALEKMISSMQLQLRTHIEEIEMNHNEIQALYEETTAMNEELENLISTLDQNYQETIVVLANAIEASDHYTRGHCERVEKYSILLADAIGMTLRDQRTLRMAAILHDIGKIGVPSEVLTKESALTDEEFEIIKRHSEIGYQIIKDIEFLSESAQIVLQHHERYDGKGYNNGISGEDILISARIICIADAYDAMTSSRAYRKSPLTKSQAIKELVKGKDTQFDGRLVDSFVERLTKKEGVLVNIWDR
ncbi:MAG: hypothetical protein ACD_80C00045G0001 [uncultured bacterium (gcode 4)]|uniref:Metal dependent phosphohydrolase n=1 Tax=uncultured bacterium (gcode 4) TaxID=1234023 RepID=K1YJE9_9BACT|nr:MAG: hypothetical protein ACD_80C00045G0001 [uncultured bacterium (gcode 4)]